MHTGAKVIRLLLFPIGVLLIGRGGFCRDQVCSPQPHWIYFTDKGVAAADLTEGLGAVESALTPASRERRLKRGAGDRVSTADLPVSGHYLKQLRALEGVKIRFVSRWLNAVSAEVSPTDIDQIRRLPFVERITPVAWARSVKAEPSEVFREDIRPRRDHVFDYGSSLRQNAFLNAPELHDRGVRGEGIIVGICDTGFDNLDHECYGSLIVRAAWDFVNGDDGVGDEGDAGNGEHGHRCLSILAGLAENHLIGLSPGSSYVLAKTENTEHERPVEEDAWIAAVEWMDSLGVDVVSSSVGYLDWYSYEDLDGETCAITIAADHAASVGMVIVNANGNYGANRYPRDKMCAPADGDEVISVGALNRDSTLAAFSSHGPTYDGRIKPDVVTYGSSVVFASSLNDDGYGAGAGTSFAAPAIAGLCALIIQADPYLTASDIRELLHSYGDRSDDPDTLYGWGIPDGLAIYNSLEERRTELVIPLRQGWNMVSMNLFQPPAGDFRTVVAGLVERRTLLLAKDGGGRFYAPLIPFNNIPFWDPLGGYQLSLAEPDTLIFEGVISDPRRSIPLREGWQLIAYIPNWELPAPAAFSSLVEEDQLVLAKDAQGRFYLPQFDFCNLPPLRPGGGYLVKTTQDIRFSYPRQRLAAMASDEWRSPQRFTAPATGANNASLLVLAGEGVKDGDEFAVFDSEGRLLGAGVFDDSRCGFPVWVEESASGVAYVLFTEERGEIAVTPHLLWGDPNFEPNGVTVLRLEAQALPTVERLSISASPNPSNGVLIFRVAAPYAGSVRLKLIDVNARVVFEEVVATGASGGATAVVPAAKLGAGVYFAAAEQGGRRAMTRCVMIK